MRSGAVVVAAGRGQRLGRSQNKALVALGGRPLLFHALERFAEVEAILEIVLVVHPDDYRTLADGENGRELERLRVTRIVEGGARRQDSVLEGLRALSASCEGALVHDAARPFVSPRLIERLARGLKADAAVIPSVPVRSTVKMVADHVIVRTVRRDDLWLAQTPQCCRRDLLISCLEDASAAGLELTDEAQALESYGYRARVVEDSPWNIKITTPQDLELAELLLPRRPWEYLP